jgi:hypothetical protein
MKMKIDKNVLNFLEAIWVFLPEGKIKFHSINFKSLNLKQTEYLRSYQNALLVLTVTVFIVLFYPRLWTLLIGLVVGLCCIIMRNRNHKALKDSLKKS